MDVLYIALILALILAANLMAAGIHRTYGGR